jgi:hypothetical protein
MSQHVTISEAVHRAGQNLVSLAESPHLSGALNVALGKLLTWPFHVDAGVASFDGEKTEEFGTLVYAGSGSAVPASVLLVNADNLACVIDACERFDLAAFRSSYERVARAKQLKKSSPTHIPGTPHTTVTMGMLVARDSEVPLESLAEELEKLNSQHSDRVWPDMVVVLAKGVINYAVQFPGTKVLGDYLPPAADVSADRVPAMYVVMVVKPTGDFAFNKMCSFLLAHLALFSPGSKLPNFTTLLEGVPQQVLTMHGYQYNLRGQLAPVPRNFYNDRLLPLRPYLIQGPKGELLSALQFIPWQDGGVILLRGKLPLEGLIVFLGKEVLARAGKVNQPPDLQISYVLPITDANFREMLTRIQKQSNMTVRLDPTEFVIKKFADEGSSTPFVARICMGILRLRDAVFPDVVSREPFDKAYEFVMMNLLNTRSSAKTIKTMIDGHTQNVATGRIARLEGPTIRIDEDVDKELRKEVENFLNLSVRVLKHGMQQVANTLQLNLGFLFKKREAFEKGHASLSALDNPLGSYILASRKWTERLIEQRNAVEHDGWMLPRFNYSRTPKGGVEATQPQISGQRVQDFVEIMLDRLCCFVEEVSAHALQSKMTAGISMTEIPRDHRLVEMPERFRLALRHGGTPIWIIGYHSQTFDEI